LILKEIENTRDLEKWLSISKERLIREPEEAVEILEEIEVQIQSILSWPVSDRVVEFALFIIITNNELIAHDKVKYYTELILPWIDLDIPQNYRSEILSLRARLERNKGETEKPYTTINAAIEEARNSGDRLALGFAYRTFAYIAYTLEENEEAISILKEALKILESIDDYSTHCRSYVLYAICCRKMGDYNESISIEYKAIDYAIKQRRWGMVANALSGIVEDLIALDRIDDAENELKRAKQYLNRTRGLKKKINDEINISEALLLSAMGEKHEAVRFFKNTISNIRDLPDPQKVRRLKQLSILQQDDGLSSEAILSLEKAHKIQLRLVQEFERKNMSVELKKIQLEHERSERKMLELHSKELDRKNKELEATINRLHEIHEDLLNERKLSTMARLLAGISHELNTPLGIIKTTASYIDELLHDTETSFLDNKLTKGKLQFLFKNMDSSIHLIQESDNKSISLIKEFKRLIDSDFLQDEKERVDIHDLILEAWSHSNEDYPRMILEGVSNISERKQQIPPKALLVALEQIFENSRIHAYSHEGGIVNIRYETQGNNIILRISDKGKGICDEVKENLFETYTSTTFGQGRSGLGLFIAYTSIANFLKGKIYSEPASLGAFFVISWPMSNSIYQ